MNLQDIKEQYARFKRWQRGAMQDVKNEQKHLCSNCGFSFTGIYFPTCSQRAGVGSIGWHSVHQSVMDVWGLGSRSIVNSVWQLLLRLGYTSPRARTGGGSNHP